MNVRRSVWLLVVAGVLLACGEEPQVPEGAPEEFAGELEIGAIDDLKADGDWGAALQCKPIPDLEPLENPEVVISLDGLTLHLTDEVTGYDAVFPIGPGAIEDGESLTPTSLHRPDQVFYMRMDKAFGAQTADPDYWPWSYAYSCRIWWKDSDSGKMIPVFAGLPFIRLEGAPTLGYAIHGPVDSYTMPNGGRLRRGFVSHGCVRMESEHILELFARTRGHKVPVRIQQAVERRDDGTAVDLSEKWLLAECDTDADCDFDGGFCHPNPYGGHGFCTKSCMKYCPDRFGQPVSFCVEDPFDAEKGICTLKSSDFNNDCRRYPGFALDLAVARFNQPVITADVCLPGSQGWVGMPCFTDLDCGLADGVCQADPEVPEIPGFCSLPCERFCPDLDSYAGTFCVDDGAGQGQCVQKCALQDDCPFGYTCSPDIERFNEADVLSDVCLPE